MVGGSTEEINKGSAMDQRRSDDRCLFKRALTLCRKIIYII